MNKLQIETAFYTGFMIGTSLVMLALTGYMEVVPAPLKYTWAASVIGSCIMIVVRWFYVEYKEKEL